MAKSMAFLSLFALYASTMIPTALAGSSCIAFDVNWNLLAFNLGGKDWNAGAQSTWGSGSATDITTSGRPPFDTNSVTCYLSQFGNAIYVMGADSKNPSNIGIYDAAAKSWSTQATTPNSKFDPSSFTAILDHDTDVFYVMSHGFISSLLMDTLKTAKSTALAWQDQENADFDASSYQPVMGLANNHIHFLNVPGVPAGSARIWFIHFASWQPAAQAYGDIPATHGQTASIFLPEGVQQEFAFVPDDGSATYVINVLTNSTQKLAGPPSKDSGASYFGAPDSIVQLDSKGAVSFLPYNGKSADANKAATWSSVKNLAASAPPGTSTSTSTSSSNSTSGTTGSKTNTPAGGSTGTPSGNNTTPDKGKGGAVAASISFGFVAAFVSAAVMSML